MTLLAICLHRKAQKNQTRIESFFLQELETRIDTQKQTLQARDESIKKLLEMLQSKGEGKIIIYLSPIRARVKVATLSCQYVE